MAGPQNKERSIKKENTEKQKLHHNDNRSSSSSSSSDKLYELNDSIPLHEVISIKEESAERFDEIGAADCGGAGTASSTSSDSLPKPMEGLNEGGPPPFLKKIFEMVEDPETDPIVSWSEARNSFIVWDSYEFSKNLLPKYFKHRNFSSFIRQLNTYGFRKVDSDKWEFANEGFQGGKKHLLKNIKRRSRYNKQQLAMTMKFEDLIKPGVNTELESLRIDNNLLKVEILKLREQQQDSLDQLTAVEERIRYAECKQQQMLTFLTKMSRKPAFIRQLIQKRMLKELNGSEFGKSRRLLTVESLENFDLEFEFTDIFPEAVELESVETHFQASVDNKTIGSIHGQNENANNMLSDMSAAMSPPYNMPEHMILDEEFTVNDSKFLWNLRI